MYIADKLGLDLDSGFTITCDMSDVYGHVNDVIDVAHDVQSHA